MDTFFCSEKETEGKEDDYEAAEEQFFHAAEDAEKAIVHAIEDEVDTMFDLPKK
jgi:hypothetical protein